MKILREVYLRNESHLPEHGWLQSCWTCDIITSRTIEYKKITEGKNIYKFIVYLRNCDWFHCDVPHQLLHI